MKIASNKGKFKNSISLLQGNASERSIALPLEVNHMEPSDLSETLLNDDCKCSSQLGKYHITDLRALFLTASSLN